MRTKVIVILNDIKKGDSYVASSCPVARAIRRATGKRRVLVSGTEYTIASQQYRDLPKKAIIFIKRFDAGLKVHPFSFYVTWDA